MAVIAIFGGTFDPPTLAHELIIQACLDRTDIDEIWVMPSGKRADKPGMRSELSRLAMLYAVKTSSFSDSPRLKVTDFEMRLPTPSQTHKTVKLLREAYPEHSFWHVYGADSYHDMPSWRGGVELQQVLGFLLVPRVGYELPDKSMTIRHLFVEDIRISSTEVREKLKRGEDIGKLVSGAVSRNLCDIYHI